VAHSESAAGRYRGRLSIALVISVGILVVEVVAGLITHSLALLADAGHVFADVSGIGASLGAIWIANRAPTSERSYGLYRLEIVAATANALLLLGMSLAVLWEAARRLFAPPAIQPELMIVVAIVALAANLVSLRLLSEGRAESLTVRGAYLEVLGDVLGAAAVLVAGVWILTTGFRPADALASVLIGVLILPRSWSLFRDSIDVLLEATPRGVDLTEVRRHILDSPGVRAVHDLHAWTITSGMNVVSAHVVMGPDGDPGQLLDHLGECLSKDFDIDHSTFQLETPEHVLWEGRASQTQH
jgi:cobalt-zinc-cadmium efflux system protein